MIKFAVGFVLGIVVSTVGVNGVVKTLDSGVQQVQSVAKEAAK